MRALTLLRTFRRDTSGAVAVEFVLIAPILFALLFGIITLGYFMGVSHSVQQLATGAARTSVAGLNEDERRAFAAAYLQEAENRYPLLSNEALTTQVSYVAGATPSITVSVSYASAGTLLDVADGLLGLNIDTINGNAYVAY